MSETKPKRVWLLDFLRGFSILSMIGYHAMFDLVYMFGVPVSWYKEMPGYLWQQSICWVFILVSGASLHYGKHPVRRGGIVFACGLVLTVVTRLVMPGQSILFGILHFMGLAMILAAPLRKIIDRMPPVVGLLLFFVLFLLLKRVPYGYLGFADIPLVALPRELYSTSFLFPLGFPGPGFSSSDYFPLIPWFFLFLSGYCGWSILKSTKIAVWRPSRAGPLSWLGKYSLPVYMLHQPVLYGLFLLIFTR